MLTKHLHRAYCLIDVLQYAIELYLGLVCADCSPDFIQKPLKRSSIFAMIYAYILKYCECHLTPCSLKPVATCSSPRLTPLLPHPFYLISPKEPLSSSGEVRV